MLAKLAIFAVIATVLVHFGFMYKEMNDWVVLAQGVAGISEAEAQATKAIGLNMGLYNGFFAVGLTVTFFGWLTPERSDAIRIFILICVVVAGIVGAMSLPLKWDVFLAAQAAPAAVALVLMYFQRR